MSSKTVEESGHKGSPYIQVDFCRAPVSVAWWATTPAGHQSKHWHGLTFYRLRHSGKLAKNGYGEPVPAMVPTEDYGKTNEELLAEAANMQLPYLPGGYVWHGPFFRHNHDRDAVAPAFGDYFTHVVVVERIPSHSAGRKLAYVVDPQPPDIGIQIGDTDEPTPGPRL